MSGLTRGVEPGVSLLSSAECRVVIHPVGQLPRDVLDGYIDIISKFKHVSLSASRSFYRDPPTKTPFQYLDWSNGYMHFRFMQADQCRRRSRLSDLHRQRQVVAAIGLVYCPLTPSVQHAYEEFTKACKSLYPEALVQRCFVVEPSEEQLRQAASSSSVRDMVMFPPGSQAHFQQHLEVWMHDLAALVLTELEKWVLSAAPSPDPRLNSSYTDSPEFTGSNAVIEEVTKRLALSDDEVREKKRWARLMKAKGDACFMAGTPQDALDHYRSSAEVSKVSNDLVWYGAAVEGMAAARLIMASTTAPAAAAAAAGGGGGGGGATGGVLGGGSLSTSGGITVPGSTLSTNGSGPVSSDQVAPVLSGPSTIARKMATSGFTPQSLWRGVRASGVEGEVRELMADARAAYRRRGGCASVVVEQNLKLIRLIVGVKGVSGARKEALELAGGVLELVGALHTPEDRITALVEVAQVVGCMGSLRRRMLLLWQALEIGRSLPAPLSHAPTAPNTGPPGPAMERQELLRLAAAALLPPEDLVDTSVTGAAVSEPLLSHPSAGPAGALSRSPSAAAPPPPRKPLGQQASLAGRPVGRAESWLPPSVRAAVAVGPGAPAGVWDSVRLGLLEASLTAARQAGAGTDLWEAAAALLRDHHLGMSVAIQGNLLEVMASAAAASPPHARSRTGPGPPLVAHLRRVLPHQPSLQPARLSLTSGRLTLAGAAGGKGSATTAASPFIFSAVAAVKKQGGTAMGPTELILPEWVCGEECCVEVSLTNPLSVPLRLEKLHTVMTWTPPAPALSRHASISNTPLTPASRATSLAASTQPPTPSSSTLDTPASGTFSRTWDVNASGGPMQAWQPVMTSVMLAPQSKPTRLLLTGRPQQPGTYVLTGVRASLAGASWLQPFQPPGAGMGPGRGYGGAGPQLASLLPGLPAGRGRDALQAPVAPVAVPLHVLPPLPLLVASLQGTDVSITAPSQDELGGHQLGTGPGTLMLNSDVVHVFEGQVAAWKLVLTNSSTACAITHINVTVVNAKGVALKALSGVQSYSGLVGPHLEVADGPLTAGLPLAPGKSVTLPVSVHVGRLHKKQVLEEALEVRLNYTSLSVAGADECGVSCGDDEGEAAGQQGRVLGRRLLLPIVFRIQAALQLSHITFSEYFSPLRNGRRCTRPHISVRPPQGQMAAPPSMDQAMQLVSASHTSFLAATGATSRLGHRAQRSHALIAMGPQSQGMGGPGTGAGSSTRVLALDLSTSRKLSVNSRNSKAQRHSVDLGMVDLDLEGGQEVDLCGSDPPSSRNTLHDSDADYAAMQYGGASTSHHSSHHEEDIFSRPPFLALQPSTLNRSTSSIFRRTAAQTPTSSQQGGEFGAPTSPSRDNSVLQTGKRGLPWQAPRHLADTPGGLSSSWNARDGGPWTARDSGQTTGVRDGGGGAWASGRDGRQGVGLAHDCVMTLVVYNDSDRYFRVWLGQVGGPGGGAAEGQEAQVVLQPRGSVGLWAHLQADTHRQRHVWSGSGSDTLRNSFPGGTVCLPLEADRMAAAEALATRWALCYQVINGDGQGGTGGGGMGRGAPHGMVRLAAVDAALSLTGACASLLLPAPLHFHLEALLPQGGQPTTGAQTPQTMPATSPTAAGTSHTMDGAQVALSGRAIRLRDLSKQVVDTGGLVGPTGGELWGLQLHVGSTVDIQLTAVNRCGVPLHVQYSVAVASSKDGAGRAALLGPDASADTNMWPGSSMPGTAMEARQMSGGLEASSEPSQQGVLVVGPTQGAHTVVMPGQPHTSRLQLVCLQSGFYQLHVTHVLAAPIQLAPVGGQGRGSDSGTAALGSARSSSGGNARISVALPAMQQAPDEGEGGAEQWQGLGEQLQLQLELGMLPRGSPLQPVYTSTDKINMLVVMPASAGREG